MLGIKFAFIYPVYHAHLDLEDVFFAYYPIELNRYELASALHNLRKVPAINEYIMKKIPKSYRFRNDKYMQVMVPLKKYLRYAVFDYLNERGIDVETKSWRDVLENE